MYLKQLSSCLEVTLLSASTTGVPIDMIGGTSIGACVGALYCEEKNAAKVDSRAREFSKRMARYGDKILDLTYPHSAMFSGQWSTHAVELDP